MSFFPYNLWYIGSCLRVFSIKKKNLEGVDALSSKWKLRKHGLFISCNQEIKQNQLEEFLSTRMDDDMEMSDEEPSEPKKKKPDEPFNPQQLQEFC